jgi:tripeptidyl-peptidase-1
MSSASLVTVLTPGALGLGGESMIEIARSLPASGHWIAGAALGTAGSTGALDPDHELVFAIPQLNLEYLKTLHSEVSDPTHPKYGQYLGFEEVGDLVRNEKSMRVVRAWLTDAGVSECTPTKHLEYVRCVAPTSKWNSVLDAQFREYRSAVATAASVVRAPKVHVPSFVREHLSGILLASELPPPRTQGGEQQQQQRSPSRSASAGAGGYCDTHPCCTPTLLNKVYNFTTNSGSGLGSQSVFETGTQTMSPADLAKFQTKYASMAAPQPIAHDIGGNVDDNTCKYLSFECGEANLDIQYIMAQAQDVPTTFWSCQECSFANWITQVANMANSPLVHSISYGQDESQTGPPEMDAFSTEAMKLGVKGITVLASSGDDGVAGEL